MESTSEILINLLKTARVEWLSLKDEKLFGDNYEEFLAYKVEEWINNKIGSEDQRRDVICNHCGFVVHPFRLVEHDSQIALNNSKFVPGNFVWGLLSRGRIVKRKIEWVGESSVKCGDVEWEFRQVHNTPQEVKDAIPVEED